MLHLDLFSGIGGFAYAADQVWDNVEHVFCDFDPFCRQVLKKHWPEAKIYGDIRQIDTNPFDTGLERVEQKPHTERQLGRTNRKRQDKAPRPFILTGGFPCQPFSAAGLRRGTADERHLWPEMLRVIRLTQPEWVIAENVRGILTWNGGLVFEQVCSDLEAEGYEVQPLIIPAVAVNAPHRRDRVWFIAYAEHDGKLRAEATGKYSQAQPKSPSRPGETVDEPARKAGLRRTETGRQLIADTRRQRWQPGSDKSLQPQSQKSERPDSSFSSWERNWPEVAAELCSVADGLPAELGGLELSKSQHRKEQIKAYGNAIVPQVAVEIMRSML